MGDKDPLVNQERKAAALSTCITVLSIAVYAENRCMGFFAMGPLFVTVPKGTLTPDWIQTLGNQELLGDMGALGGEEESQGQLRRCSFPIQRGLHSQDCGVGNWGHLSKPRGLGQSGS